MGIIKLTDSKYTGLSRDIKPREAKLGASFYEYDTEDIYDKTLNINNDQNGWKKRVYSTGGGTSDEANTIKSKITSKSVGGVSYIVLMAGSNYTDFEMNDIVIGLIGNKLVMGMVDKLPVNTSADFGIAMQGGVL